MEAPPFVRFVEFESENEEDKEVSAALSERRAASDATSNPSLTAPIAADVLSDNAEMHGSPSAAPGAVLGVTESSSYGEESEGAVQALSWAA